MKEIIEKLNQLLEDCDPRFVAGLELAIKTMVEYAAQSTQEGGTVEAEQFLRDKGIIKGECKHFIIDFPDDREVNVGEMLTEYTSQVSATDKKRISELEKEVEFYKESADTFAIRYNTLYDNEIPQLEKEVERLRGEMLLYGEWARINGERYRGNLQKNGIELYNQYLKDKK